MTARRDDVVKVSVPCSCHDLFNAQRCSPSDGGQRCQTTILEIVAAALDQPGNGLCCRCQQLRVWVYFSDGPVPATQQRPQQRKIHSRLRPPLPKAAAINALLSISSLFHPQLLMPANHAALCVFILGRLATLIRTTTALLSKPLHNIPAPLPRLPPSAPAPDGLIDNRMAYGMAATSSSTPQSQAHYSCHVV
jgi:hypothetical protein